MKSFSSLKRHEGLREVSEKTFDLLIIGGGITGAGILLDAVTRGLSVILVEKGDFASGTSSKSTKLIHGGLRYLKQLEIGLVREVGKERAIVYRNARHIVRPERMLLPFYKDGSMGKWTGSIGLWLYDRVAGVEPDERRKVLSQEEALEEEPLLDPEGLTGAGLYYEYRTDDARLTIEVMKTAVAKGGLAFNYVESKDFIYSGNEVAGAICADRLGNEEYEIQAKCVVNAAGPWVDEIRAKDKAEFKSKLFLTSGIHIVVPRELLPLTQSLYFESRADGRMIFCVRRNTCIYIGTTDVPFDGNINEPPIEGSDVQYLLDAVNNRFPGISIQQEDIIASWSGLRPLIYQEGKSASELSRKDEIFISTTGLVSIAGGKLTGYRMMAERVVDLVCDLLGKGQLTASTAVMQLSGCGFASEKQMADIRHEFVARFAKAGISREAVIGLFRRYGSNCADILQVAEDLLLSGTEEDMALLRAELDYGVKNEMVCMADDFTVRRTSMAYFEPEKLSRLSDEIDGILGSILTEQ